MFELEQTFSGRTPLFTKTSLKEFERVLRRSHPSLVVGWGGWNHLQQGTAIVAYYDARKNEGWSAEQLKPLLAALDQLPHGFTNGIRRLIPSTTKRQARRSRRCLNPKLRNSDSRWNKFATGHHQPGRKPPGRRLAVNHERHDTHERKLRRLKRRRKATNDRG